VSYRDAVKPRLFGHRGASGVLPENTIPAFELALEGGATHLETDVHMTRDGEVVVLHDTTVDRTTKGTGEVRGMTFAEAKALGIPALREVLERFPHVPLNIEVKQAEPPMLDAFLDVLDRFGARPDVLVAAEDDAIMWSLRARDAGVLTGFSTSEVLRFVFEGSTPEYRPPGFALQIPETYEGMTVVTKDFVDRARRLGVEVHVWTVNDVEQAKRLLALSVDGIMSDVPGELAGLFAGR